MSVNLTILIIAASTIIASLLLPQHFGKSLEYQKDRRRGKRSGDLLASELLKTKKKGEDA